MWAMDNPESLRLVGESPMEIQEARWIGSDDHDRNILLKCPESDAGDLSVEWLVDDFNVMNVDLLCAPKMMDRLCIGNVTSLEDGNGDKMSVLGNEITEEGCDNVRPIKGVEEKDLFVPGQENYVDISKDVMEVEGCNFPSLSPLRTVSGDELGTSRSMDASIGISITDLYGDHRDCKEYDDASLGQLGLVTGHPMTIDTTEQEGQNGGVSLIKSEINCVYEKCKDTLLLGSKRPSLIPNFTNANYNVKGKHVCNLGCAVTVSSHNPEAKDAKNVSCDCSLVDVPHPTIQGLHNEDTCLCSFDPNQSCSLSSGVPGVQLPCYAVASRHHLSNDVGSCPLKQSSELADDGDVRCSQVTNGCTTVYYDHATRARNDSLESNHILTYRRTNPKQAASLKTSACATKTIQLSCMNMVRKSKKSEESCLTFCGDGSWISLYSVGRRSCSCKNSSGWGDIEKLHEIFHCNNRDSNSNHYLKSTKRQSRKAENSKPRRYRLKSKKDGTGKSARLAALANSLDSEEEKTSEFISPETIVPQVLQSNDLTEFLLNKPDRNSTVFSVEQVYAPGRSSPVQLPLHHKDLENPATFMDKDVQHTEKDLESSVTQEASPKNNPSVSSQAGYESLVNLGDDKLVNYLGASPESDVIHPTTDTGTITSDSVTSSTKKQFIDTGIARQNNCPIDVSVLDHLHFDVLNVLDVAVPSTQFKKYARRKKDRKNEGQEDSLQLPDVLCEEQKAENLFCQDNEGKSAVRSQFKTNTRIGSNSKSSFNGKIRRRTWKKDRVNGQADLDSCGHTSKLENGEQSHVLVGQDTEKIVDHKGTQVGEIPSKPVFAHSTRTEKKSQRKKPKGTLNFNKRNGKRRELLCHLSAEQESQAHDACIEDNGSSTVCLSNGGSYLSSGLTKLVDLNVIRNDMLANISECSGVKVASGDHLNSGIDCIRDDLVLENTFDLETQGTKPLVAWVCCDDCNKWRCISAELADAINETNCKWTCKDNLDKAFANCLIPQEKTNAEINAELDISDVSGEEDSTSSKKSVVARLSDRIATDAISQQSTWKRIKTNFFLHRNRKTQTIDEIMVCHCKPPLDGSLGCGDQCLNRMLNIECVRGTCPCGEHCSNLQFQKRKYAKLKPFSCGKKGVGLKSLQNVFEGKFLIEYVGEVLDMVSYENRQKEYASRGQKHFYFMTLNCTEVIDACAKGNLARFINHSCEPNCRTEKWMVNGEICIGLFAVRDIKKGEELTFDYNYVRIFGAAAKKCVCGSAECRGYIGGDPLNSENVVIEESDEEYPEPIVHEFSKRKKHVKKINSDSFNLTVAKPEECKGKLDSDQSSQDTVEVSKKHEICPQGTNCGIISSAVLESEVALGSMGTPEILYSVEPSESDLPKLNSSKKSASEATTGTISNLALLTYEDKMHASKLLSSKKSSQPTGLMKKVQTGVSKCTSEKAKKIGVVSSCSNYFDGVAEKLNELIGHDGGIMKMKDAAKGYLKLLVVTAANNAGTEAIHNQSTRDLSLILDALLKTKSKAVLLDILDKNGLQMLHNIMKQNRRNSKIPILRKLLKVLRFLVENRVLSQEEINMKPFCVGVESLQDSIISLTYHTDKEVHQAAREFRDRWIIRVPGKSCTSEVDKGNVLHSLRNMKSSWSSSLSKHSRDQTVRDGDAISRITESVRLPSASLASSSVSKTPYPSAEFTNGGPHMTTGQNSRKRKSRWDQDKPTKNHDRKPIDCSASKAAKASLLLTEPKSSLQHESNKLTESGLEGSSTYRALCTSDSEHQDMDEAPPGFACFPQFTSLDVKHKISDHDMLLPVGKHQEVYLSQLPVSHGIPLALMQQLGTPSGANTGGNYFHSWSIAPGIPFYPFPPLPTYPREEQKHRPTSRRGSSGCLNIQTSVSHSRDRSYPSSSEPSVSGRIPFEGVEAGAVNLDNIESGRQQLLDVHKRKSCAPQHRYNPGYQRSGPPWNREKNGYACNGNRRYGIQSNIRGS